MITIDNTSLKLAWFDVLKLKRPNDKDCKLSDLSLSQANGFSVLSLVSKFYPTLIEKMDAVQIKPEDIDYFEKKILENTPKKINKQRQYLTRIIAHSVEQLECRSKLPKQLYPLPRHTPLVLEKDMMCLESLDRIIDQFKGQLKDFRQWDSSVQLGALLFSSVINGAQINKRNLEHIYSEHASWITENGLMYVQYSLPPKDDDIAPEIIQYQRWIPDAITQVLVFTWIDQLEESTARPISEHCFIDLKQLWRTLLIEANDTPPSMEFFIKMACSYQAFKLPIFIGKIISENNSTVCLPPESWLRVISGDPVQRLNSHSVSTLVPSTLAGQQVQVNESYSLQSQQVFMKKIRFILKEKTLTSKQRIEKIESHLNSKTQEVSTLTWLLGAWSHHLLRSGGLRKKKLSTSVIQQYLSTLTSPVLSAFDGIDINTIHASEWLDCLQSAIDNSHSQDIGNKISYFMLFAMQFDCVPTLDLSELEYPDATHKVSANLITVHEFEALYEQLGQAPNKRVRQIRLLVASLAFYCGLRHSECKYLLIEDICGKSQPELLIRANKYRSFSLKSRSSERRLDLSILLPESILDDLMAWQEQRLLEVKGKSNKSLLFLSYVPRSAEDNSPLQDDLIFTYTQALMREITHDQTLVFHHLRHSFANWTLIRLLISEFPEPLQSTPVFLKHRWFNTLNCHKFRYQTISDQETKKSPSYLLLYWLAVTMGHASPQVTIKHYLHLFDWISAELLREKTLDINNVTLLPLFAKSKSNWNKFHKQLLNDDQ